MRSVPAAPRTMECGRSFDDGADAKRPPPDSASSRDFWRLDDAWRLGADAWRLDALRLDAPDMFKRASPA